MRNAVILHGTDGSSNSNWIPWLKDELGIIGYEVWAPDLPNAGAPNTTAYTRFIAQKNFHFNEETILIGHSSGAVAWLGLLPKLGVQVRATTGQQHKSLATFILPAWWKPGVVMRCV